jgi:translation elongation factor P/translation initiation factor 5A
MEAVGIFDGKKKVIAIPGHERLEVPMIKKLKGQILSVGESTASVMDLESFETLDVQVTSDVKESLKESDNVEYWDIDGKRIIKRKL